MNKSKTSLHRLLSMAIASAFGSSFGLSPSPALAQTSDTPLQLFDLDLPAQPLATAALPTHAIDTAANDPDATEAGAAKPAEPKEEGVSKAADPVALGEVVVTAARPSGYRVLDSDALGIDLPLKETPATVNVITEQFLIDSGARKLADVIAFTPGVVNSETSGGGAEQFLVRGFATSFTYINGVRQAFYDQRRSLASIDRVEVVKGPAGVEAGVADPGGTVNILTKKPQDQFGASFSAAVGDYNFRSVAGDVTGPIALDGRLQARLIASYEEGVHWRPGIRDRLPFASVAPSLKFDYLPTGSIYAEYEHIDSNEYYDRGVLYLPGAFPGGFAPRSFSIHQAFNSTHTVSDRIEAGLDQKLGKQVSLRLRFQDVTADNDFRSLDAEPRDGDIYAADGFTWNGSGRTLPIYYSAGPNPSHFQTLHASVKAELPLFGVNNSFNLGYEHLRNVSGNDYSNQDVSNTLDIFAPDNNQTPILVGDRVTFFYRGIETIDSVFGQWVARLTPRFRTVVGVRHDDYTVRYRDTFADPGGPPTESGNADQLLSYRVAASFDLSRTSTAFAGYSNGFQPQGGFTRSGPAPALRARSFEAGVKVELAGGKALWTNTVYTIRQDNQTIEDPTNVPPESFVVLFGAVRVRGFESELTGKPWPGLDLGAGVSLLQSRVVENSDGLAGNRFTNVPNTQASAFASYNFAALGANRLTARFGLNALGNRAGDAENRYKLPGYVRIDTGLGYRLTDRFTLDLHVENLLDKTYYVAADQGGIGGGTVSVGNRRLVQGVLSWKY